MFWLLDGSEWRKGGLSDWIVILRFMKYIQLFFYTCSVLCMADVCDYGDLCKSRFYLIWKIFQV